MPRRFVAILTLFAILLAFALVPVWFSLTKSLSEAMGDSSPVALTYPVASQDATPVPETLSPEPVATAKAAPTPTAEPPLVRFVPLPRRSLLYPMSHAYQTWNNCGPVAALMALSYYGVTVSQPQAASALKPHPQDKSVSDEEMVNYLASFGLESRILINGNFDTIEMLISKGIPVVLNHRLSLREDAGHYTVARGYDKDAGVMVINDSYYGPERRVSYSEIERLWEYFNRRYIPVYRTQDRPLVDAILDADAKESTMLQRALAANQARVNETPNNANAWANLGETHFLLNNYSAAVSAWERAQKLGLYERILWYTYWPATAYNALGLRQEALAIAQRAIAQEPASPEMLFEQGLAYMALGDKLRARQALNQAIVYMSNYAPELKKARRALEELDRG